MPSSPGNVDHLGVDHLGADHLGLVPRSLAEPQTASDPGRGPSRPPSPGAGHSLSAAQAGLDHASHTVAAQAAAGDPGSSLIGIDEVQKALNRSRASVYRYTNTDPRNLNPPFNPRRLNPEYRSDQKEPLLFHPDEVARFARDVLRIKEVTVEVLNSPSTASQQLLGAILSELQAIRQRLDQLDQRQAETLRGAAGNGRFDHQSRPAA